MHIGLGLSVTQAGNSESPLLPPSPSHPTLRPANPSICKTIPKVDLPAALFLSPPPPCPRPSCHFLSPQFLQGPHNWSHCPIPVLPLQPRATWLPKEPSKNVHLVVSQALKMQPKLSYFPLHTYPWLPPQPPVTVRCSRVPFPSYCETPHI